MADRFWVGGTGNWSDNLNHWSASTGGAPNASLPTSADNVFFDVNSFNGADQVVTIDVQSSCLGMDWTGATNTPTFAGNVTMNFYGSITLIAAMTITNTSQKNIRPAGAATITSAGNEWAGSIYLWGTGSYTLADDFVASGSINMTDGTLVTAGFDFTCANFTISDAGAKVITLSTSTFNCTAWNYSGSNLTLTANTATIKITGTGVFAGGGITTYHNVELNGTAHTISGDNTFATLALPSGTTQTLTFGASTIQTATTMTLSGDATHAHTIKSGTAGTLASLIAATPTDDYVTYTDIRSSWSTLQAALFIIYSRTLNAAEITSHYNRERHLFV